MTLQEAKEVLLGLKKLVYKDDLDSTVKADRDHEAIDIAIAAIKFCEKEIENGAVVPMRRLPNGQ